MRRLYLMLLLGLALPLAGCSDMHDQPSVRAFEAPQRTVPAGSVPTSGPELFGAGTSSSPSPAASSDEVARGQDLYRVNCAFCHGQESGALGSVGKHLRPPPPGLDKALLQPLPDEIIFRFISLGLGRMPPFQHRLTSEERWALVRYLRSRP